MSGNISSVQFTLAGVFHRLPNVFKLPLSQMYVFVCWIILQFYKYSFQYTMNEHNGLRDDDHQPVSFLFSVF